MSYDYGSQYQLRRSVLERTDDFDASLRRASPTLDAWVEDIEWIAPVAEHDHELRDEAWSAAELSAPSPQNAGWWPQRGQVWDAVAKATGPDGQAGAIFVEAKGREAELRSGGSKATDPESISAIRSALADVQAAVETPIGINWMGPMYQPANRLAMLYFARCKRNPPVPVWLVSSNVCGEHYKSASGVVGPADEESWRPIIRSLHDEMGLPHGRTVLSDWWVELFLPALAPPPTTPPSTWE